MSDFTDQMDKIASDHDGETPDPVVDEAPVEETPAAESSDGGFPDPAAVTDDMPYRDAKKLRDELSAARDEWKPYADAFGGLDADTRSKVLGAGTTLGADLALISDSFSDLHPDDRRTLAAIVQTISTDPEAAAGMLAEAADALRGGPAPVVEPGDEPDPDEPVTRADLDRMMTEAREEREAADLERATNQQYDLILTEARDLGYDPTSTDPDEQDRFTMLLSLAQGNPDGNLKDAHARIEAREQKVRDEYAETKREDSRRPQSPSAGASPTDEKVLETMDDAGAAMNARMDAAFGPRQPRR